MLAYDEADVISKIPRFEDLTDLPPGVLAEITQELKENPSAEEPIAMFNSGISP